MAIAVAESGRPTSSVLPDRGSHWGCAWQPHQPRPVGFHLRLSAERGVDGVGIPLVVSAGQMHPLTTTRGKLPARPRSQLLSPRDCMRWLSYTGECSDTAALYRFAHVARHGLTNRSAGQPPNPPFQTRPDLTFLTPCHMRRLVSVRCFPLAQSSSRPTLPLVCTSPLCGSAAGHSSNPLPSGLLSHPPTSHHHGLPADPIVLVPDHPPPAPGRERPEAGWCDGRLDGTPADGGPVQ